VSLDARSVPTKWHPNSSNGLAECTNVTNREMADRQTALHKIRRNRRNHLRCKSDSNQISKGQALATEQLI